MGPWATAHFCLRVDMPDRWPSCLVTSVLGLEQGRGLSWQGLAKMLLRENSSDKELCVLLLGFKRPCCAASGSALTLIALCAFMLPVQPCWSDLCPSCVAAPEPDLVKVNIPDPGKDSDQAVLQPLLGKDQQEEALAEGKTCLPLSCTGSLCHPSFPLPVGSQQKQM